MDSCVYEGHVRHRRFQPVQNRFRYHLFLMFLDLAELPHVFAGQPFWSSERVNLAYFRRQDHLGDPRIPIDQAVRDLVEKRLGNRPTGPIRLLTHLRYLGYCFNPVSLYYCYDRNGQEVESIVAEIHNTPWGEEYCYVLGEDLNSHPVRGWKRYQHGKDFHISPFMDMDVSYDWRFREPGETISVHMISTEKGMKLFDATLTLKRREISRHTLNRILLAYPLMTLKVTTMIYLQAIRLWSKGAPFYLHPSKRRPLQEGGNP
jgi:DUF1365 family protein